MVEEYGLERFLEDLETMRLHRSTRQGLALKKPLLLLLVLSRLETRELKENRIRFPDIEKQLATLITKYGGRSSSGGPKPEQPFDHLSSSPFWHLELAGLVREGHGRTAPTAVLRDPASYARLPVTLFSTLAGSAQSRARVTDFILAHWWPDTIWPDLRAELGLDATGVTARKARDKKFVELVLRNYAYRCAVCGFDAMHNGLAFGVDAGHIRWHTHGGPDSADNGLALCKLHHWAFDRGILGVVPDRLTIEVAPAFVARDEVSESQLGKCQGCPLATPRLTPPAQLHLEWHREMVFCA